MNNKELQKKAIEFYKQHKAAVKAVRTNVDLNTMDKVSLSSIVDLYEPFDPNGYKYLKDDVFKYNGNIYKVVKDHTSESHYKPDTGLENLYYEYSIDPRS